MFFNPFLVRKMKFINFKKSQSVLAAVALIVLSMSWGNTAQAQYDFRWLAVGDFQHRYNGGLGQPEIYDPFPMMVWPGIRNMAPGGVSYMHVIGYWISVANHTSEDGTAYPVRTSHSGPRALGVGEFYQTDMQLISKFDWPEKTVDGSPTFQVPIVVDAVSDIAGPDGPDQMVINKVNTSVGISVEQRSIQFSNQFHDDYHITEFRFTNTGNVDGDPEIELDGQVAEDVYFSFIRRPKTSASSTAWDNTMGDAAWGAINQTDIIGNGENDYGLPEDWRGMFTWMEHAPARTEYSTIGGPMWVPGSWWYALQEDTTGRLNAAAMHGEFILHADGTPHAPDPEGLGAFSQNDDLAQPDLMTYMHSDDSDLTGNSNHNDVPLMIKEREWIENGVETRATNMPNEWLDPSTPKRTVPAQPFLAFPLQDGEELDFMNHFATTKDPATPVGSWSYANNFGPYTMQPGEEVRIVIFDGVAGLSETLAEELGQWYRQKIMWEGLGRDEAGAMLFSWDPKTSTECEDADAEGAADTDGCISLTKDQWVMTSRDSLFQLVARAKAAFENGYRVPAPPRPPSSFNVTSGTDQITIAWTPVETPSSGWELYRAQNRFQGIPAPNEEEKYVCIAGCPGTDPLGPEATSYADTDAFPNVQYYYYLQAVGSPGADDPLAINGTPGGVRLKSSRYYAQSYDPARLLIPPGESLSEIRMVPNPVNLGADQGLRWPGEVGRNQITFWKIPGQSTIQIFTELGELVKTIEHTSGSGVENWNLTTESNQRIVSGIYIVVIRNDDTGEQVIKKLLVIR